MVASPMKLLPRTRRRLRLGGLAIAAAVLGACLQAAAPRLRVLEFDGPSLRGNPLGDPTIRRVALFAPRQDDGSRLPLVYYLPGWDNSSASFIRNPSSWLSLVQQVADRVTPVRIAVVDGDDRWGGSQYLNSPAQGNYADYLCRDVVAEVEASFPVPLRGIRRIIAGHSSGGFGALRLAMAGHGLFDGVVALSPDSDFPVTHLPLVRVAAVVHAPPDLIERCERGRVDSLDGDVAYVVGLSAAYAPSGPSAPGRFDWLYDRSGAFRPDVWSRWLANDPLTIVRENPSAFSPRQRIYLDGAAHDEFLANIGARAIYEVLRNGPAACTFDEAPGHHSTDIEGRLARGLAWVFAPSTR